MRLIFATILASTFWWVNLSFAQQEPQQELPAAKIERTGPEACKLITLEDVSGAMGKGFKPADSGGSMDACTYKRGDKDHVGLVMFKTRVGAADALKERQELMTKTGRTPVPLSDLGDFAFSVSTDTRHSLEFGKGPWLLEIDVYSEGKPDAVAAEKLAKIIYSRLP